MFNVLKFILRNSLIFFIVTLLGMTLHEVVRKMEAKCLGYESVGGPSGFGVLVFSSEKMQSAFRPIFEKNYDAIITKSHFQDEDRWNILKKEDTKDHALIELSGLIYTLSLSLLGLLLLLFRRKYHQYEFKIIDWIGIYLSLFILKEFFPSLTWSILGYMPCEHAKFYDYFGLPIRETDFVLLSFSFLFAFFTILMFVPKKRIFAFIIAGIIGGFSGIIVWLRFFGDFVF